MIESVNCKKMFENGVTVSVVAPVIAVVLTVFFLLLAEGPGATHGCFLPGSGPIAASFIYGPEALLFVYGLGMMAVAKCIQSIQKHRKRQPAVQPDNAIFDNL